MSNTTRIGSFATVAMIALSFTLPVSAQVKTTTPDFTMNTKGVMHLNVPVKAGTTVLQPGMYQVQHAVEGRDHFISFKVMGMPAGYRHSNNPVADDASARIKCEVEAVDKKVSRTAITLRTNPAGEKDRRPTYGSKPTRMTTGDS